MGCDGGYLVSDKRFGGADTWATSYVLAQVIRSLDGFDLIVAGERATDGDTGQVGPGIASWLDVPCVTYVASVTLVTSVTAATARDATVDGSGAGSRAASDPVQTLGVERLVEEGYQQVDVDLPALITVVKEIATPRLPTLAGKKRSMLVDVPLIDADAIDVDPTKIGLKGSPTKVVRIRSPKVTRGGRVLNASDGAEDAVRELVRFLREREVVSGGDR
jgi:electron transfer flavoprotein beta subunit